jgi:dephospho-CoA kinase
MSDVNVKLTSMKKIALTGGIACGKSQVLIAFKKAGFQTIELDKLARSVVLPHSATLDKLQNTFGSKILQADKTLNRQVLREILLQNPSNQATIEAILHPEIFKKMQCLFAKHTNQHFVVEIARLNAKNIGYFDNIVEVKTQPAIQLKRLMLRDNINQMQAQIRINAQQCNLDFSTLPIHTLTNNTHIGQLSQSVTILAQQLFNS